MFDFAAANSLCIFCDASLDFHPPPYIYEGYYGKACKCGAFYYAIPVEHIAFEKYNLLIIHSANDVRVYFKNKLLRQIDKGVLDDKEIEDIRKLCLL